MSGIKLIVESKGGHAMSKHTLEEWEKIARYYIGKYLQHKHNPDLMPKTDHEESLMPTCHPSMIDAELSKRRFR